MNTQPTNAEVLREITSTVSDLVKMQTAINERVTQLNIKLIALIRFHPDQDAFRQMYEQVQREIAHPADPPPDSSAP